MSSIFYQNLQCKSKLALVYMHMTLILSPLERLYRTEQALCICQDSVRDLYQHVLQKQLYYSKRASASKQDLSLCVCVCVCVSEIIQGKPSVYQNR